MTSLSKEEWETLQNLILVIKKIEKNREHRYYGKGKKKIIKHKAH
jgi:hypothetical protein